MQRHIALGAAALMSFSAIVVIVVGARSGDLSDDRPQDAGPVGMADRIGKAESTAAAPSADVVRGRAKGIEVAGFPTSAQCRESNAPATEGLAGLRDVLGSFATADPNLDGIGNIVAQLGRAIQVDADSVGYDADNGVISGRLSAGGLEGQFTIEDNEYQIVLPCETERPGVTANLTISFSADGIRMLEKGGINVQQQFDPGGPYAKERFVGCEEHLIGWSTVTSADTGTTAKPLVAQAVDNSLYIGHSRGAIQPQRREWDWSLDRFYDWYHVLSAFAKE